MNNIEAVIFDMDGVIVHSNPTHKEAIQEFCVKYDLEVTEEEFRQKVYGRTNQDWLPAVFGDLPDEEIQSYADEKEAIFRAAFDPREHKVSGIIEFLDLLRKNDIKCVVATSAPAENAEYILSELSLNSYFLSVLNSSHVTKSKPHPEPYLKAAKSVAANPENCIVFEDSISGVESGLAAGSKVVGVATTHTHEELSNCSLVIDDFKSLELRELQKILT
ncbi:HAD family hydrolase [Gracilimonas halophila]|uniref:HAD family hydrolase n=1 Tax=Gracilimonas halophila TaxID=1834464 RepID=A0ABW5JGU6_9BACT